MPYTKRVRNVWPFGSRRAKPTASVAKCAPRASLTVGSAAAAAYKAGAQIGSDAAFENWLCERGLQDRGNAMVDRLRREFHNGVEEGETGTKYKGSAHSRMGKAYGRKGGGAPASGTDAQKVEDLASALSNLGMDKGAKERARKIVKAHPGADFNELLRHAVQKEPNPGLRHHLRKGLEDYDKISGNIWRYTGGLPSTIAHHVLGSKTNPGGGTMRNPKLRVDIRPKSIGGGYFAEWRAGGEWKESHTFSSPDYAKKWAEDNLFHEHWPGIVKWKPDSRHWGNYRAEHTVKTPSAALWGQASNPHGNESVQDKSWREFTENAAKVARDPEAASNQDLYRAISFLDKNLQSIQRRAWEQGKTVDPNVIAGYDNEVAYYKGIIERRRGGRNNPEGLYVLRHTSTVRTKREANRILKALKVQEGYIRGGIKNQWGGGFQVYADFPDAPEFFPGDMEGLTREIRTNPSIGTKDPRTMTAGEINKEIDKLDKLSSANTDAMIAAGRGHERPSDWYGKEAGDPLAAQYKLIHDRRSQLVGEVQRQMGPGHYSFPYGWRKSTAPWMRTNPRRRNPDVLDTPEAADALYETFHGREPHDFVEVETRIVEPTHLTTLGTMVSMKVETITGKLAELGFEEDPPYLCSSPDGTQLYIQGGNQSLDVEGLGFTDDYEKQNMVIGDLVETTYRTQKAFDKFKTIDYYHANGEEQGVPPQLLYDPINKIMTVAGGTYKIEADGIID